MKQPCPRQEEIRQAFIDGPLEGDVRSHALQCPDCSQALAVASALREMAAQEPPQPVLPRAEFLWMKARMEQRVKLQRRRQLGVAWISAAAVLLLLLGVAQLLAWLWGGIAASLPPQGLAQLTDSLSGIARLVGVMTTLSLATALLSGLLLRVLGRRLA
ncbi:MAG TPA: hypothetical protein VLU25_06920 [Acidobacteriota bacterium]|nr:hypothetical protein [Acidobacteriota bacterium]